MSSSSLLESWKIRDQRLLIKDQRPNDQTGCRCSSRRIPRRRLEAIVDEESGIGMASQDFPQFACSFEALTGERVRGLERQFIAKPSLVWFGISATSISHYLSFHSDRLEEKCMQGTSKTAIL